MPIEHIENTSQENEFPFAYLPSKDTNTGEEKIIGSGWESIVKKLGPNWVIKEVNSLDLMGNPKKSEAIERARDPQSISEKVKEQSRLEEIFSEEYFLKSHYVLGKNPQGKEEYMLVQKFIKGKTIDELISGDTREYASLGDLVLKNREQFKKIIWATKKAFLEFGAPLDFHTKNFMRNDITGKFVLIDSGEPSQDNKLFSNSETSINLPQEMVEGLFKRVNRINEIEEYLKLSEEERIKLDEEYNVSKEKIDEKIKQMQENLKERESARREKRKHDVENFLDTVFKGRGKVTGNEIVTEAIRIMGNDKIPDETQQIMDKLALIGESEGDKDYWLEQIIQ